MADTRRQQNGPDDRDAEVARHGSGAAPDAARAAGDAVRRGGASSARVMEQGGGSAAEAMRRTGEAGAEAILRAGGAAGATARRGAQLAAEAQQRLVDDAAERLKDAGRMMARAAQRTTEDVLLLVPRPGAAGDGLQEAQQALAGLVENTAAAGLRVTQELFRLANPGAAIELQQRFLREYLGIVAEGQAMVLRAARRTADEALRPIERQLELRRRGRQEADQGGRRGSRVADVMSRDLRVANPEDTVQQAARAMREADTGVLPVGEDGRLVGMVTDRDVALRLVADGKDPARTKVREVMTPEVLYIFEDEDLPRAAEAMAERQVRRLPVVNRDKRLVGIVSLGDLAAGGRTPPLAGRALAGVAREGGPHGQAAAE